MTKLLLLDCDGTIREPLSSNPLIQHPRDQKMIKGADKAIAHFHSQGWSICGISNQGGVAAGHKSLEDAIAPAALHHRTLPPILPRVSPGGKIMN